MNDINIDNFKGIEVDIQYETILDKYSKECADIIKDASPKRTGKYANGWRTESQEDYLGNYSVVVFNKTDWQLTHLLENGHNIVNKKGGVGWASAKPHIKKGYNAVKNAFIKEIEEAKLKVNFK